MDDQVSRLVDKAWGKFQQLGESERLCKFPGTQHPQNFCFPYITDGRPLQTLDSADVYRCNPVLDNIPRLI